MGTIDTILQREQVSTRAVNRVGLDGWQIARDGVSRVFENVRAWACKRASRRTLRDLTDVQLSDIGVTRGEATREVGKSFFWD